MLHMANNVTVVRMKGGYRVCLSHLPGLDESWIPLYHFALFKSRVRAETFSARVAHRVKVQGLRGLNLKYWVWTPTNATPLMAFQRPPTAKMSQEAI